MGVEVAGFGAVAEEEGVGAQPGFGGCFAFSPGVGRSECDEVKEEGGKPCVHTAQRNTAERWCKVERGKCLKIPVASLALRGIQGRRGNSNHALVLRL